MISIDLSTAIKSTNEILAGKAPEQKLASRLFFSLCLTTIFMLVPRLNFLMASDFDALKPVLLKPLQGYLLGPDQMWLLIEAIVFFLLFVWLMGFMIAHINGEKDRDPKTDAYSPIREELQKIPKWELNFKNFSRVPARDVKADVQMVIENKFKKLDLKFLMDDDLKVNEAANDVSLRLDNNSGLSLLFFVDTLAAKANGENERFQYLLQMTGNQVARDQVVEFTGIWYRLSEQGDGLAKYGFRGPCVMKSVLT
jgi:hypothetical protein